MDRTAIEEQLEALHPASYGWALACCGRRADDAEDVLQNVYLKIIEGKARFDGRSSLKTWLFGVIRRTAAQHFRWRRLRERFRGEARDGVAESDVDRRDLAARVRAALERLSTRQRQLLELVFYHGMTIEEAAATLRISIGSARVHYDRGKRRVAELLAKEERLAFA